MSGLRTLAISDIGQALELSEAEKWNQTAKDWELLIRDPNNVCLGFETSGKIIATATAINYDNEIAWIGMVLVDREYRGRGLSKLLISSLLEQLKSFRSIKLDATPSGQQVYRRFGFKKEYMIHRMVADPVFLRSLQSEDELIIKPINEDDIPEIVDYDKFVVGAGRKQLIEALFKNYPGSWMLRRDRRIAGIVMGRYGASFHQAGPVIASNTTDAKRLILKFLIKLQGQAVVVDILDDKKELMLWLNILGFTEQRHYMRMYRGGNIYQGITQDYYLICGPEFG